MSATGSQVGGPEGKPAGKVHPRVSLQVPFWQVHSLQHQPLCSEMIITLGAAPLARYGTPGTSELAQSLEPLIPHHCAILMANHGVVTYGADLQRAFMCMETVEHFAKITLVTHLLGRQTLLNDEQVGKLREVAEQYVSGGGNGLGRARASELQQRVQPVTAALRKDK